MLKKSRVSCRRLKAAGGVRLSEAQRPLMHLRKEVHRRAGRQAGRARACATKRSTQMAKMLELVAPTPRLVSSWRLQAVEGS